LGDRVAANFTRSTVVICNVLGTLLKSTTDNDSAMIDLADDEDRRNDARGETLQNNSLIVIDRNWGTVVRERDRVGGRRRIVGLRRWRRGGFYTTWGFGDIDNVHNKGVYSKLRTLENV
jgi:hypothetical protein